MPGDNSPLSSHLCLFKMSEEEEEFDFERSADSEEETSSNRSDSHSGDQRQSQTRADDGYKREHEEEEKTAKRNSFELGGWNAEELTVVDGLKDQWFLGNAAEKKEILEGAVAEVLRLGSQNPETLKGKIRRWLNKKCAGRNKYGPGQPPSLRSIIYYYKQREMEKVVKEKYGVGPGDKEGQFVGHLSKEMANYQRKLKEDPSMAKELEKCQKQRQEWARVGVPGKRKKQ